LRNRLDEKIKAHWSSLESSAMASGRRKASIRDIAETEEVMKEIRRATMSINAKKVEITERKFAAGKRLAACEVEVDKLGTLRFNCDVQQETVAPPPASSICIDDFPVDVHVIIYDIDVPI
jgi:hypothetical protein